VLSNATQPLLQQIRTLQTELEEQKMLVEVEIKEGAEIEANLKEHIRALVIHPTPFP